MARVLDILFPLECVACGAPGAHACGSCLAAVPASPRFFEDSGSRAASGFAYANPFVRRILHDAKFEGWTCALDPLETLARRAIASTSGVFPPDAVVVAVPLHPSKLRARGFNQADAIARAAASATGRRAARGILERARMTRPQTDARDRAANVQGAFVARLPQTLRGKAFLLVDDVRTSGATLEACARALMRAGARRVDGFALAWGGGLPKAWEKS